MPSRSAPPIAVAPRCRDAIRWDSAASVPVRRTYPGDRATACRDHRGARTARGESSSPGCCDQRDTMTTSCRRPPAESHLQAASSLRAEDRCLEERQDRRFPIDEFVLDVSTRANDRKSGVSEVASETRPSVARRHRVLSRDQSVKGRDRCDLLDLRCREQAGAKVLRSMRRASCGDLRSLWGGQRSGRPILRRVCDATRGRNLLATANCPFRL